MLTRQRRASINPSSQDPNADAREDGILRQVLSTRVSPTGDRGAVGSVKRAQDDWPYRAREKTAVRPNDPAYHTGMGWSTDNSRGRLGETWVRSCGNTR